MVLLVTYPHSEIWKRAAKNLYNRLDFIFFQISLLCNTPQGVQGCYKSQMDTQKILPELSTP